MSGPKTRLSHVIDHNLGKLYDLTTQQVIQSYWSQSRGTDSLVLSVNHPRKGSGFASGGAFLQYSVRRDVIPSRACSSRYVAGAFNGKKAQDFAIVPSTAPFGTARLAAGKPQAVPASLGLELGITAGYGPEMWDRAKPGKAGVNLLVSAKELLSDGLPTLPGRLLMRLARLRSVGKEYLNVQFGWMPLLKDIRDMYETYTNLNRKLNQLQRDNGRLIRRRRSKGVQKSSTSVVSNSAGVVYSNPSILNYTFGNSKSSRTVTTTTTERIWFAGAFRYYIPDVGTDQWTKRATRALFGLNPSPEVLWQALPWSWLIDWFSNIGHVMSNMSENAAENLVAEYAFVMREKTVDVQTTVQVDGPLLSNNCQFTHGTHVCSLIESSTLKTRAAATPYGFAVSYDTLTGYQAGILAALGISRSRF